MYYPRHEGLRVKAKTEKTDWRAKQPSQLARVSVDLSVEELETLPAGTKPRTSRHQSPGGERNRKSKHSTIFLWRTSKGHRQSGRHWNCFKSKSREISERRRRTCLV